MRVVVDRDRCEGNAICVGIDPELFQLDEEDYVMVTADPIPADAERFATDSAGIDDDLTKSVDYGAVYEKDLGPNTAALAEKMTAYDPGPGWKRP